MLLLEVKGLLHILLLGNRVSLYTLIICLQCAVHFVVVKHVPISHTVDVLHQVLLQFYCVLHKLGDIGL